MNYSGCMDVFWSLFDISAHWKVRVDHLHNFHHDVNWLIEKIILHQFQCLRLVESEKYQLYAFMNENKQICIKSAS